MARKAYILFPNEANHSGGFAPHSVNPSPCATASGNTHMHMHITVEVGPVMSYTHNTQLQFCILQSRQPKLLTVFMFSLVYLDPH